jgi:NADPH-dependent 2,4-dienoyl-CoA reductase/sulfur reductase-like enzyme
MAGPISDELIRHDIDLRLATGLTSFGTTPDGRLRVELSDGSNHESDLALLAIGVRPDSALARDAGLELNQRGYIVVDRHQRTSDKFVYAVGDVTETAEWGTGLASATPLAGPANRQGRAAADHMFGVATPGTRPSRTLGTAIIGVFDQVAATTGVNEKTLRARGADYRVVHLHPGHHAGYYPGAAALRLTLIFDSTGLALRSPGRPGWTSRSTFWPPLSRSASRWTSWRNSNWPTRRLSVRPRTR